MLPIFKKTVIWLLILESRLILAKYKPFIAAVTGSVGKTSTKDAIYSVLKNHASYVRKSEKSMNSEIGLPLTIIGAPNAWHSAAGWFRNIFKGLKLIFFKNDYPSCLILEIGADHPGDIRSVTKWLHPNIAVITKISHLPVHVEFFKSPEEVFNEKAALVDAVKSGGTLVVFADDQKVLSLGERVKGKNVNVVSYGFSDGATVKGAEYGEMRRAVISGLTFKLGIDGNNIPISIPNILGKGYVNCLLAAAAVGKAKGMTVSSIVQTLGEYEAPRGRMNIISGINGSTIIDDSYNSSPDAVLSALETLQGIECASSKIAILGDMMELGKYSAEEHHKVGIEVAKIANQLITVGSRSRATADEAIKNGLSADHIHSFATAFEAADFVRAIVKSGDIILVKGSQSVRMERVVKSLLLESERAGELLVRQEKEWLEKP